MSSELNMDLVYVLGPMSNNASIKRCLVLTRTSQQICFVEEEVNEFEKGKFYGITPLDKLQFKRDINDVNGKQVANYEHPNEIKRMEISEAYSELMRFLNGRNFEVCDLPFLGKFFYHPTGEGPTKTTNGSFMYRMGANNDYWNGSITFFSKKANLPEKGVILCDLVSRTYKNSSFYNVRGEPYILSAELSLSSSPPEYTLEDFLEFCKNIRAPGEFTAKLKGKIKKELLGKTMDGKLSFIISDEESCNPVSIIVESEKAEPGDLITVRKEGESSKAILE